LAAGLSNRRLNEG